MKRIVIVIICILIGTTLIPNIKQNNVMASQQTISKKIIRFHVIANSDSNSDQNLKLKVRDKVLQFISPKLKDSKNIEESRKVLKDNTTKIKSICEETIKNNGYNYPVQITLSNENFPIKSYGCITLPQGNYEAYRIIIGSGKGHNWWCVMFPPLCFVDITKGQVSQDKTKEEMQRVLNSDEMKLVDNTDEEDTKIHIKFKIVEFFEKLIK